MLRYVKIINDFIISPVKNISNLFGLVVGFLFDLQSQYPSLISVIFIVGPVTWARSVVCLLASGSNDVLSALEVFIPATLWITILFGVLIIQIISCLSASVFGFRSSYMANHRSNPLELRNISRTRIGMRLSHIAMTMLRPWISTALN